MKKNIRSNIHKEKGNININVNLNLNLNVNLENPNKINQIVIKNKKHNSIEKTRFLRKNILELEYEKLIQNKFKDMKEIFEINSNEGPTHLKNYRDIYFFEKDIENKELNKEKIILTKGDFDTNNQLVCNLKENENGSKNAENENATTKIKDDECTKIDKLSLISISARYELLKASKQLVDFDVVNLK